jgi:hypothetical protein
MRVLAGILGLLAMGGCMPVEKEVPTRNDPRYTCNAAKLQGMIGQVATQALGTEALRASGARTMRWIEPGAIYTMEYREDRLNIHLDARNRVTKINCG